MCQESSSTSTKHKGNSDWKGDSGTAIFKLMCILTDKNWTNCKYMLVLILNGKMNITGNE